jgi:hypothetical protein
VALDDLEDQCVYLGHEPMVQDGAAVDRDTTEGACLWRGRVVLCGRVWG